MKFGIFIFLFVAGSAWAGPDFSDQIRPILSENCFHCHGPDENDRSAGLRLDTAAGAKEAIGDKNHSELLARIESNDPDEIMPPPKSKLTLTAEQKKRLRDWIEAGANFEEHWSFVPPVKPDIPKDIEGTKNPIDAFVGRKLKQNGLAFAAEAEPHRLIRRVTLDLTGLPPTIEEVDQFIAAYRTDNEAAYEAMVDRLLNSPRYGETMALPWLDAARYADTDGYQFDGPRFMWRWRDWVIDAYNSKKPFDQFTIEQLAGDLLPDATLDQKIATGFNRNHRYNSEAGLVVEEYLLENAVDRVDTTSTLWMGLTIGCARCHDHKYDPISQKDYYQLIAFFNSIPESGRAVKAGNSEPVIVAPTADQKKVIDILKNNIAKAKASLQPVVTAKPEPLLVDRHLKHRFLLDSPPENKPSISGKPVFENNALKLDGDSTLNLGGIEKSLTMKANQKFSISFWLNPESLDDAIVISRQKGGSTRPGIEISLSDNGRLRFDLISRWVAGVGRVTTESTLKKDEWTHVTLTVDGTNSANGQIIYLNGKQAATSIGYNTNSNIGGVNEASKLIVGGGIRPGSGKLKGQLRDLRLYETMLWPEEVEVLGAELGSATRANFAKLKASPNYTKYTTAREKLENYTKMLPTVMVMQETPQPKVTHLRNRGEYHNLGEIVSRDVPEKFFALDADMPKNRLGLAKWLLDNRHPLTARVAVNRYWQKYFGTGLVKTAEDFGVQGEAPSHPELLDWLAVTFRESGWDVAAMQKLIVMSRTYRQKSHPRNQEVDPHNRLLSCGPRIRLSGHAIRDQALFVSGLLKERVGGPSVSPYQPANLWAEMSMGMKYRQSKGDDLYRRSLYTIWKRTVAPPTMAVFDSADREACWVSRKETNTPLQALTLLNETGFVESARHLAVRMLESGDDPVAFGFRTVTARDMTNKEKRILETALTDYQSEFSADEAAAKKLIATGESKTNQKYPATQIAAYTALANVLLNLDEVINRE